MKEDHLSVICAERQRITFALDAERESLLASQSAVKDLALRMQECAEEMEREVIRLRAEVEELRSRQTFDREKVRELVGKIEGWINFHADEKWNEIKKELGIE